MSVGEGSKVRRIHSLEYPHSLGTFYESVTSSLGFKPSRHEGKIVGLAAYGNPDILIEPVLRRFHQEPGNFRIVESNNIYFSRYLSTLFPKIDVAAVYQRRWKSSPPTISGTTCNRRASTGWYCRAAWQRM